MHLAEYGQGRVLYSRMLASLLLPALAAVSSTVAQAAPVRSDTAHIVVVATTDVHGRATGWDYLTNRPFAGGLARAATVVDSLRARYPGEVVAVDAGDLIQGDPFAAYFAQVAPLDPNPVMEAMNLLGYDAATLGNHEFNWGLPTLRRILAAAAFPYVSANIFGLPADTLVHRPYVVLRRGGVRIGITGFTTPGVMVWDRDNVRGRVRVGRIGAGADGVLRELRARSDLAVVLVHSGMDGPASYDTTGAGPEDVAGSFARGAVRPDLVVVGHSHREMRDSVIDGVHFVQPKNWAQSLSVMHIDLVREAGRWRPVRWRGELVPLGAVAPSPRVTTGLASAHQAVLDWTAQPLAEAAAPMPAALARAEPSAIMNYLHSVQLRHTGAQLSAAAAFSTAGGFPAGQVRLSDVAGIYPYENTLRAIRLSGAQLKAFLEHSARYYRSDPSGRVEIDPEVPGYNFDMVAGARYDIDLRRPVGDRIRGLSVGGRPVAPTDSFTMAVNNYRQGGGGGYAMLQGAPVVYDRGENIRDLIVADLRARRRIDPREFADANWRIVPLAAAAQVRALQGVRDPKGAVPARDSVILRIAATSDLHGALLPRTYDWSKGRPVGGAAALATVLDTLEASCGCPMLWLDGGDQMQGTLASNLFAGRSTVDVLNRMGLSAAVVGNHELDWSVDTLRARMTQASYPWLAANVFDSATGRRPDWAVPSRIITVGSLRVGVIGYMTPQTKTDVMAEHVRGFRFGAGKAAIADVLDAMRASRPDFTILVAHEGGFCDSLACRGEIVDLARELGAGAVDAIVAGHTHQRMATEVAGIPIVQARSSGTAIGVIDFVWRTGGGRGTRTRVESVYADSVVADSAIGSLVARYARQTDSIASRPIAALKLPLPKLRDGGGQYALGNLIADAQRNAVRAQVSAMNNGGIRGPGLPAGPLTYANLFELQPFQNEVVTLTVTGSVLRKLAEHAVASGTPDAHLSGMTVQYDPRRRAGKRVVGMQLDDGSTVRNGRRYTLAVTNFMAGGGSGFAMLKGLPMKRSGITDIDALSSYLRRRPQPVEVPAAPRFVSVRR